MQGAGRRSFRSPSLFFWMLGVSFRLAATLRAARRRAASEAEIADRLAAVAADAAWMASALGRFDAIQRRIELRMEVSVTRLQRLRPQMSAEMRSIADRLAGLRRDYARSAGIADPARRRDRQIDLLWEMLRQTRMVLILGDRRSADRREGGTDAVR